MYSWWPAYNFSFLIKAEHFMLISGSFQIKERVSTYKIFSGTSSLKEKTDKELIFDDSHLVSLTKTKPLKNGLVETDESIIT